MLDRFVIADTLREIAALLELKEANPYKIRAYRQAAHSLEITDQDVDKLYLEHRLEEISAIGAALAATIEELYRTGASQLLEQLRTELPSVPLELVGVDGLNLKKIARLQEALGITTKAELLNACQNNLLSSVPGLGKSLEQKLLRALTIKESNHQIILETAIDLSARLIKYLKKECVKIETAGQIRRWQEVVDNIDLVASSENSQKTKLRFEQFPTFLKCEWLSSEVGVGYLPNQISVKLTITSEEQFWVKLHEMTGSSAHIQKLWQIANRKHIDLYKINGQSKSKEKTITEAGIYSRLRLPYIPPELREDWGEIEEAERGDTFDDLIKAEDIQGMVHCHTNYSDGNTSIEKMARTAQDMGYSYITITDHSPTAFYANGLDIERLKRQWDEIELVQEKLKIKLLRGTESDILASGLLDYPDAILEKFDVIIGSIHSRYKMNEDQMTQRIKTCMALPIFKIWGHALGRLLLKRDPVPCRVEEVLDVVANSRVAIEINGDPHRMDLEPIWLKEARKRKIKFVISTDAHSPEDLLNLPFGIHMARRAHIRKDEVLNALPYSQFKNSVRPG